MKRERMKAQQRLISVLNQSVAARGKSPHAGGGQIEEITKEAEQGNMSFHVGCSAPSVLPGQWSMNE